MPNFKTWTELKKKLDSIKDKDQIEQEAKAVNKIFRRLDELEMSIENFAHKSGVSVEEIEKIEWERPSKDLLEKISWILNVE